jgi:hypothetical protein
LDARPPGPPKACAAFPEACREVLEKGNEDLVDMLASVVEAKAGIRSLAVGNGILYMHSLEACHD